MENTIRLPDDADVWVKELLGRVASSQREVIVQDGDEAIAVVVPLSWYQSWENDREGLVAELRDMSDQSGLTIEEADALGLEAAEAARRDFS